MIQVSRKGETSESAGPDFTPEHLANLAELLQATAGSSGSSGSS